MHPYDVHVIGTVRIKIPGVMADTPAQAIALTVENEAMWNEASRLIDHEGMTGSIETIEFQSGELPVAYQVDEADPERREANTSGYAYRRDDVGRLRRVRSLMPTAFQDAVIEAFGSTRMIVATDDIDGAAMRLRNRGHDEAAALMRRLGTMSDRSEAVRAVENIRSSLDKVIENLGRCTPDIDLPDHYRDD